MKDFMDQLTTRKKAGVCSGCGKNTKTTAVLDGKPVPVCVDCHQQIGSWMDDSEMRKLSYWDMLAYLRRSAERVREG
jgi:hypothetical protein